ncbi:MAG: TonB-dependent receptor family protein [Arenicella sp.]
MKLKNLCWALSACLPLNVYAAEKDTQEAIKVTTLSPITITIIGKVAVANATIAGTPVKELPINIHVVNEEEVDRLKFVDPDEFLDRIPGESQVRNLRIPAGGKGYTIPLVDGIPLENPYEGATQRLDRINTNDIQRVEVIKGPASAVYASNAFGGVINVVSRDAPKTPETKVWSEVGNFGRKRVGVNTGAQAGKLGYFIDANVRRLDGARQEAKNDREQFSSKLQYTLTSQTTLTARLEHFEEDSIVRGDLTASQIAEDPTQAGSLSSSTELEQDTLSLNVTHQLDNGQLDASLVIREKDTVGVSRFGGPEDENDVGVSTKLVYRYDFDDSNVITGFETYNGQQDIKAFGRDDIALSGAFDAFENTRDIYAVFAQYEARATDRLTLSAGVRYEDITSTSTEVSAEEAGFDDVSPKLGAVYRLNASNRIWFGASQGFYAPDASDLFNRETGNAGLQPEESTNVEVGLRGQLGALSYDTSYYHNEIKNYLVDQEFFLNGLEFERVTNAGQVTVQGLETVVEYAPQQASWRVGFTHTYAKNIYDSFVSSDGDFSGNELRRSPRHHVNARIAWLPTKQLTAELEGDFYSSYYSDDENTHAGRFKRDERINLRVSYEKGPWSVWLHGINLTDTLEDRATYSRGRLQFRTVDGRSYYLGAEYKF